MKYGNGATLGRMISVFEHKDLGINLVNAIHTIIDSRFGQEDYAELSLHSAK